MRTRTCRMGITTSPESEELPSSDPGLQDAEAAGQQLALGVRWEQYVIVNDAVGERFGLRMIFAQDAHVHEAVAQPRVVCGAPE